MTSYPELVGTFGEDNVTSVNYDQLRDAGVGFEAARVLADVGLPRHVPGVFTTRVVGEPVNFSAHEFDANGEEGRILVIGGPPGDEESRYFLNIRNGLVGVFSLNESAPHMEIINSTVHHFVTFLHQCGILLAEVGAVAGEGRREAVEELRRRLTEADRPALEIPNSWWSLVVDGLKGEGA